MLTLLYSIYLLMSQLLKKCYRLIATSLGLELIFLYGHVISFLSCCKACDPSYSLTQDLSAYWYHLVSKLCTSDPEIFTFH